MGSLIWRQVNSINSNVNIAPIVNSIDSKSAGETDPINEETQPETKEKIEEVQKKALNDLEELKKLIEAKKEGVLAFLDEHLKSKSLTNLEIEEMSHIMVYEKTIKQKIIEYTNKSIEEKLLTEVIQHEKVLNSQLKTIYSKSDDISKINMIKARLTANMIILKDDVDDLCDHFKSQLDEKDSLVEELEKNSVELPHLSIEERKGVIKALKTKLNNILDSLEGLSGKDVFLKESREDINGLLNDLEKSNQALEKEFKDNPEAMNRYQKVEEDMENQDFLSEKYLCLYRQGDDSPPDMKTLENFVNHLKPGYVDKKKVGLLRRGFNFLMTEKKKLEEEAEKPKQIEYSPFPQSFPQIPRPILKIDPSSSPAALTVNSPRIGAVRIPTTNNPTEIYDNAVSTSTGVDISKASTPETPQKEEAPKRITDEDIVKMESSKDYMDSELYYELKEKIENHNKDIESPVQKILEAISERIGINSHQKLEIESIVKDISDNIKNLCGVEALVWIKEKIVGFLDHMRIQGVDSDIIHNVNVSLASKISDQEDSLDKFFQKEENKCQI